MRKYNKNKVTIEPLNCKYATEKLNLWANKAINLEAKIKKLKDKLDKKQQKLQDANQNAAFYQSYLEDNC